jgi:outer membrane protein assembly factor BamB
MEASMARTSSAVWRACALVAVVGSVLLAAPAGASVAEPGVTTTPELYSFTPPSGRVGTPVTLVGVGFTSPAGCSVTFNGVAAGCLISSTTEIQTSVPLGATTGKIVLHLGPIKVASQAPSFTVIVPSLTLSATVGPPTTSVTVSGAGFGANELVDLYVGTTDQAVAATDTSGSFSYPGLVIPSSAQPGTAWVSAVGRQSGGAAQSSFLVQTNWAQLGFRTAHHGFNPYENTLNTANVGSIDRDWSFATGSQITTAPTVAGDVIYIGADNGSLYALNATTGAEVWSFASGGLAPNIESTPAVVNGVAYFAGLFDDTVYALNATTGAKVWSYTTGGNILSSPAVVNGIVYIGSVDGNVYALNATTGAKLWSFATGAAVQSSPAVANGMVYVGSNNDNVYALNATTGAKVWSFATGNEVVSAPAEADGVVYVSSTDGSLYVLNATTGAKLVLRHRRVHRVLTGGDQRRGLRRLGQQRCVRAEHRDRRQTVVLRHRRPYFLLLPGGGQRSCLRRLQ